MRRWTESNITTDECSILNGSYIAGTYYLQSKPIIIETFKKTKSYIPYILAGLFSLLFLSRLRRKRKARTKYQTSDKRKEAISEALKQEEE